MRGTPTKNIPDTAMKVFTGNLYDVYQWQQELYDGTTGLFEAVDRADTVRVIGVTPDDSIIVVEDEQPHRDAVITLPGGRIDPGESPQEAAPREFLEETGYKVNTLTRWHEYDRQGNVNYTVHAFIGQNLEKVADQALEPGERITVNEYSFDEFLNLGTNPDFRDTIVRVILLEALCNPEKKKALYTELYAQ